MQKETKGTILALMAAVVSGVAIPLNKLFVLNPDPTVFTAVRAIIIGLMFLVISLYYSSQDIKSSRRSRGTT